MITWIALGVVVAVVVAILYWLFIIAEGAYFGEKAVVLLYDWGADQYDRIKDVDDVNEAWYLAEPLLEELGDVKCPLILDVATGTARLPLALLKQLAFDGHVIGLDLSKNMLDQAKLKVAPFCSRVDLIQQRADTLPFMANTFDAVTCLEALEFVPDPKQAIAEMVRVLRPGGVLMISNRIGWESRLLVGRSCGRGTMEDLLRTQPLQDIRTLSWQVYYDLVWARKKEEQRGQ
jgi:SAM-dependent methyltransferase